MTSISLILFECAQYYIACSVVDSSSCVGRFIYYYYYCCYHCLRSKTYLQRAEEVNPFYQIQTSVLSEQECNAMSELILIGNADVSSYVSPFSTLKCKEN